MRLKKEQYDSLRKKLPQNNLLVCKEEEKYAQFSSKDPFPEIGEALLNANDVAKYIITVGILEPFNPENLSGVTYTAGFSGNLYYWNDEGKQINKTVKEDENFELQPNSITFLEVDTYFRVPDYMVLRYNLRVKNVYKGLLLGTGPIIDSGFQGKLFIPLHNLTSNIYEIKKGAKLIEIEFTKLSSNPKWKIDPKASINKKIEKLDFSDLSFIANDFDGRNSDRPFSYYAGSALTKDSDFSTKDKEVFVSSSVQELRKEMNKSKEEIYKGIDEFKLLKKEIKEEFEKNERKENFIKAFSILTIIAMLLTAITLGITASNYFHQASELKYTAFKMEETIIINEERVRDFLEIVEILKTDAEIPDEICDKYQEALDNLADEIDELREQRETAVKQQEKWITIAIVMLVFTVLSIVISIFLCVYIYKKNRENSKCKKEIA